MSRFLETTSGRLPLIAVVALASILALPACSRDKESVEAAENAPIGIQHRRHLTSHRAKVESLHLLLP